MANNTLDFNQWKDVYGSTGDMNGYNSYLGSTGDTGYSLQGGMDWMGKNSDALNTGLGLAGMGMNAYSTLFGQGKNTYDKNMTLLDQQIAGNKEKMARRDALNTAWANTEKVQPKPQGLAASGQGYV